MKKKEDNDKYLGIAILISTIVSLIIMIACRIYIGIVYY